MAKSRKLQKKNQLPLTQIFLSVAILLVVVLIVSIFASRNIWADKTVLSSSGEETLLLRHYMYFLNASKLNEESVLQSYGNTADAIANYWEYEQDGVKNADSLKEYALASAQEVLTLYKLAKDAGFSVTDEIKANSSSTIDSALKSLFPNSNTPATDFYKLYGLTVDEMKTLDTYMSVVSEYEESISSTVVITDEQALAYYNEHQSDFDTVTVRHVLKDTRYMSDDEKAEAYKEAENILQQINDGADIGELAALYSDDTGSNTNNGEYTIGRGEMVAEFEDWAFSAAVGDTGIVETEYGYHVMQLMAGPPAYEEIKDKVMETAKTAEQNRIIDELIAGSGMQWTVVESVYNKVKI